MRFHTETDTIFKELNDFFDLKGYGGGLVYGKVEAYDTEFEILDDTFDRFNYWMDRMDNFELNIPPKHPFYVNYGSVERNAWWMGNAVIKRHLASMIIAMEVMVFPYTTKEKVFGVGNPFLFFRRVTLDQAAERFYQKMHLSTTFAWDSSHDIVLWDAIIQKTTEMLPVLGQIIVPRRVEDCEIYIFEPPVGIDPHLVHYYADYSFHGFVIARSIYNEIPPLLIGIMISHGNYENLERIRERIEKGFEDCGARNAAKAEAKAKKAAAKASRASGSGTQG